MVRLQRVQVYNGEEESKIGTSNGRAAEKAAALKIKHDKTASRKDQAICYDDPQISPLWIKHRHLDEIIRVRNSLVGCMLFKVLVMEDFEVNLSCGVVLFQ